LFPQAIKSVRKWLAVTRRRLEFLNRYNFYINAPLTPNARIKLIRVRDWMRLANYILNVRHANNCYCTLCFISNCKHSNSVNSHSILDEFSEDLERQNSKLVTRGGLPQDPVSRGMAYSIQNKYIGLMWYIYIDQTSKGLIIGLGIQPGKT